MKSVKVLLVEDSPSRHEEYRRELEGAGFEVSSAYDGTEVAGIVESVSPRIIVSDTDLPTVDGDQAVKPLLAAGKLEGVLGVGMSSERSLEEYWKGVAHEFLCRVGKGLEQGQPHHGRNRPQLADEHRRFVLVCVDEGAQSRGIDRPLVRRDPA